MVSKISSQAGTPGPAATHHHPTQNPVRPTWSILPNELKHEVSTRLQGRDRLNFALVNKENFALVQPQLLSARLVAHARNVRDLEAFRRLIGTGEKPVEGEAETIKGAPGHLQAKPLAALAARIAALPLHQQGPGKQLWREATAPLVARSALLRAEREQQDKSTRLADQVEHVDNLDMFAELLGPENDDEAHSTIRSLRADLQVKPLTALASRIVLFEASEQDNATDLFL